MKTFMQKRFFLIAMTFVLGILFLASCSKAKVEEYIPDNAVGVVTVNFKNLSDKADMEYVKKMDVVKELRENLKDERELSELLDVLIDDPASCGLDLRQDVALAMIELDNGDAVVEVIAKMHKKKDFEKFLDNVQSKGKSKHEGIYYIDDSQWIIAWNKKMAIAILGANEKADLRADAAKLLKLPKDKSMASNENFKTFWEKRGDMSAYVDYGNLLKVLNTDKHPGLEEFGINDDVLAELKKIDKGAGYGTLTFEAGKMTAHVQTINVDSKTYKDVFNQTFNESILNYLPGKTMAFASMAVNVNSVLSLIQQADGHVLNEKLMKKSSNNYNYYYDDYDYDDYYSSYTIKDLLSCLNGSVAFSMSSIDLSEMMPVFTLVADLSNPSRLSNILQETSIDDGSGYYALGDGIYLTVKNNYVIISNDNDALRGYANGLRSVADKAKSGCYAFVDLNYNNLPSKVTDNFNSDTRDFLKSFAGTIELKQIGDDSADLTLTLPSGNENVLSYVIKVVDKYMNKIEGIGENISDAISGARRSSYYSYDDEYDY